MVDFNNEATIATPPGEVFKIVILERRDQVIEAMEKYDYKDDRHIDATQELSFARATLRSLWREVKGIARRRMKKMEQEFNEVDNNIMNARKYDEINDSYDWINDFLDDIGLTKVDSRKSYDGLNIEEANKLDGI